MERRPLVRVVILYLHPLLGEGLAKLLAAEPGIEVTAIHRDDAITAEIALAGRPDVVVEETTERAASSAGAASGFTPLRMLVGIEGTVGAREDEPMTLDPELILRAVRAVKHRRLGLVSV